MNINDVIDEVKLELTGDVLETELEDVTLQRTVNKVLRELTRYWDETKLVTVPYSPCIDLEGFNESSIVGVYRANPAGSVSGTASAATLDPAFAQQWMLFSNGGTMYNLNEYVLNYAAWNTLLQIKNTMSTDLSFKEDHHNKKLYINQYNSVPDLITIEYIPEIITVEDIKSTYWQDYLIRMCVAMTKVIIGRIRTRFGQSNALWAQDGEKLLEEGNTELNAIRETLRTNANIVYPIGSGAYN